MVTVISGPSSAQVSAGRTVGELRSDFAQGFNIPASAANILNGEEVNGEREVRDGDKLVFAVPSGEKG